MNTQDYIFALYNTLRAVKDTNFEPDDYFWRLGANPLKELFSNYLCNQTVESLMLMGIRVEIDRFNPDELKLYEDITNKVAIPCVDVKEIET